MRIGYLIGALNPGGAERQLVELAARIAGRGHEVEVACYDGDGAFDRLLERSGVVQRRAVVPGKLAKIAFVKRWMGSFRADVVHAFMKRASSLAVLANLPSRRCRTVVCDYSTASYARHKPVLWASLVLFGLADRVVTETEMNRRHLAALAPWLRGRLVVVRNGVDLDRFRPKPVGGPQPFRFLCVGSVFRVKNPVGVVEAVQRLRQRTSVPFRLDWVGRFGRGHEISEAYREASELVRRYDLGGIISFGGETSAVEDAYASADALVHASSQEGMPNAVVEAMACGLPLIVSRVSDLPLLVERAENGFVCELDDPGSLTEAMARMLAATTSERAAMAEGSRRLAEEWFSRDRFVLSYESLYGKLVEARGGRT